MTNHKNSAIMENKESDSLVDCKQDSDLLVGSYAK